MEFYFLGFRKDIYVEMEYQHLKLNFTNYFNDYPWFTSIPKGKFLKIHLPNIKFHGIENPNHYVSNFVSAMTLKGIDKDIFHIIFLWKFNEDVMRWYNVVDSGKVKNWDDLCEEFLC